MFKSKLSRLFCLLFSCIFFLGSFGVGVSAADKENLIDSNLTNWTGTDNVSVRDTGEYYGVTFRPAYVNDDFFFPVGYIYDLSDANLISGDTYVLEFFKLAYQTSSPGSIDDEVFSDFDGTLFIGLGSLSDSVPVAVDGCFFEINKDNYNSVNNRLNQVSFVIPNGVQNPCVFIYLVSELETTSSVNTVYLVFKDFALYNKSSNDEDGLIDKLLNGIVGVFVPSDDYFDNLTKQVQGMFSNSFGFVYDVTTFFTDLMNKISDLLVANAANEFTFTLPAQQFDINLKDPDGVPLSNHHIKLWDAITLDFSFLETISGLSILYNLYRISLHMICLFLLLEYAKKTFDKVMA